MLPDFAGIKDESDIRERFTKAACKMMCDYRLTYQDGSWDITALELYLRTSGENSVWSDETTDCHPEQLNSGTWYVARPKGPGYWRLDISCGNRDRNIYGGILLGQIDGKSGPTSALHTIVRGAVDRGKWPDEALRSLDDIHGSPIQSGPLRIEPRAERLTSSLWIGPRKGLSPKHKYWNANLRIATRKTEGAEKLPT